MSILQRAAVISEDGLCRYRLDRWWGDGPRVAWIMLNPSTANAEVDDPTIRRCIAFTKAWGYDGLTVVNLWPFRSPSVKALVAWVQEPGELVKNQQHIEIALRDSALVVVAWGATVVRGDSMLHAFRGMGVRMHHLGLTMGGHPRHPLYIRGDTKPQRYELEVGEARLDRWRSCAS